MRAEVRLQKGVSVAVKVVPGSSRLRDVERYLKEHGFVVLPDNWNAIWVGDDMQTKLLDKGIRLIAQNKLEHVNGDAPAEIQILVWDRSGQSAAPTASGWRPKPVPVEDARPKSGKRK